MFESVQNIELFLLLLPVVAFMYASVGHGGASGYLALMAVWGFQASMMKPTALILNMFVSGIAFIHFYRNGYFKFNLFLPFIITSIPAAFFGGMIQIDTSLYKKILGILLLFAIARMLFIKDNDKKSIRPVHFHQAAIAGFIIGLFSGLIGIGGGIILSPLILLLKWGTMKEAAAVSALFIWLNSAAGIAGQFTQGVNIENEAFLLVGLTVIGGFIGGYFGSKKMNFQLLKSMLAAVLVIASVKLIFV
jgi:uncharacterized membrane protein YfcA